MSSRRDTSTLSGSTGTAGDPFLPTPRPTPMPELLQVTEDKGDGLRTPLGFAEEVREVCEVGAPVKVLPRA